MHCVLASMVFAGLTDKYEGLRSAYNSVIDDGDLHSVRIPPIEEWRGMSSICDNIFCRWVVAFSGDHGALIDDRGCGFVVLGSGWRALSGAGLFSPQFAKHARSCMCLPFRLVVRGGYRARCLFSSGLFSNTTLFGRQ